MLRWTSRNGRSVATPKGSGSDSMRRLWHDSGTSVASSLVPVARLDFSLDFSLKQMETEVSERRQMFQKGARGFRKAPDTLKPFPDSRQRATFERDFAGRSE